MIPGGGNMRGPLTLSVGATTGNDSGKLVLKLTPEQKSAIGFATGKFPDKIVFNRMDLSSGTA